MKDAETKKSQHLLYESNNIYSDRLLSQFNSSNSIKNGIERFLIFRCIMRRASSIQHNLLCLLCYADYEREGE